MKASIKRQEVIAKLTSKIAQAESGKIDSTKADRFASEVLCDGLRIASKLEQLTKSKDYEFMSSISTRNETYLIYITRNSVVILPQSNSLIESETECEECTTDKEKEEADND